MNKRPTMADIARIAGVSTMTVSRAFKNDGTVNAETRDAVVQVAHKLGYVFNATASSLRMQKTDFIAAIIPSLDNANFSDTISGLSAVLSPHGIQALLGYTNYDIDEEERLIGQLLRRRPMAIVVTGGKHTKAAAQLLENSNIPVIEMWDCPTRPIGYYVGFSNAQAIEILVRHFYQAGYQRIAFMGGDSEGDRRGHDRRLGFMRAMESCGLDGSRLVATGTPPISMSDGARAMAQLLVDYPDTDAVISVSDLCAFGAITECQRRGIEVGKQIAIAGFGNYQISNICIPRMTTIDVQAREIGEMTGQMLLDLFDQKPKIDNIKIEPRLIIRETSR